MLEKDFEDIICKYPELIEDGLKLIGRQLSLYGRRMDILFEDKFKRKLIIELKVGPIKDDHIGQILSYEGMLLSADDPAIRVMLVGNRVPPNIQKSLDHHGIAWKEIIISFLKEFLRNKGDVFFNRLFEYEEPVLKKRIIDRDIEFPRQNSFEDMKCNLDLIKRLQSSDNYKSFKDILPKKINNEAKAKKIIIENLGSLRQEHLIEVLKLIDEPYPYYHNGKIIRSPWFGRLLKSNTKNIFEEDKDRINQWFKILSDNNSSVEKRLFLLKEQYKIKGLSVGFITLMFYILDKTNYSIWFEGQHNGLKLFYHELEKFTGKYSQYLIFNDLAKEFVKKYNFEHSELDWVLSTGTKS